MVNPITPRIYFDVSRNVGIGTSKPTSNLDISGNIITRGNITANDINFNGTLNQNGSPYIGSQWTSVGNKIYYSTGNVGVGISNPQSQLDVSGNVTVTGNIIPGTNITYNLGSATHRWKDLYLSGNTIDLSGTLIQIDPSTNGVRFVDQANNLIISTMKDVIATGNVTIGENLTVNGTFTTLNTETVTVEDPIITVGGYQTLTVNDNKDRGIEFRYYDGSSKVGFFGYDNNTGNLVYLLNATNTNEVFNGTSGTMEGATFKSTVSNGTAPLTVASSTVVTNLNADLLDGQEGSYYNNWNNLTNKPNLVNSFNNRIGDISLNATDISNALTYVPLNTATYTASDILNKLKTVDGTGSQLDADLLDGQEGSYYNNYNNLTNKPTIINSQWTTSGSNIYYTTGSVGIGITSPANPLDVSGNGRINGSVYIRSLGVGVNASGTLGEILATNNITAYYSDQRLKTNIQSINNAMEKIMQINGVYYNANNIATSYGYSNDKKEVGVLAQEIQSVLPEVVTLAPFDRNEDGKSKSGENYLTVHYEKIIPLLINGIKELQGQINELKNR